MNATQIFNMISRMFTHRAMNWGINKGVDHFAKGKSGKPMTHAQRRQAQNTKKRTRQAMHLLRRFLR